MSGTRLVLTLDIPGATPAEVRAYAEQIADRARRRAAAGLESSITWQPGQFVDVQLVDVEGEGNQP